MRRWRQLADVKHIDELAAKASGEIAVAAILQTSQNGFATIEAAADYAKMNPGKVVECLGKDLYFRWISEALSAIRKKVIGIDSLKIGTYDAASKSTKEIFENVISSINNDLKRNPSGIYPSIEEIFANDERNNKYTAETLNQIKNVKLITDQISRLVWLVTHPYYYLIIDRRWIVGFLVLFVVAVPVWYFFGAHGESIHALPEQTGDLIKDDIRRLREVYEAQDRGVFAKATYFIRFAWDFFLSVPSIFAALAAGLALVRRGGLFQRKTLQRYEKTFGDIAMELQKIVPNRPKWPSVEVKLVGDFNVAVGRDIQQVVKSTYLEVKGKFDSDIDSFLKEVADVVEKSSNPDAAAHYRSLVDNLKKGEKSIARSVWEGLVKILKPVGEVAGAASAVSKLFGPS